MINSDLLIFSLFITGFCLVANRISRMSITGPMLFIGFGFLVGPQGFDLVNIRVGNETVRFLAEITLALVLFTDASRINFRSLMKNSQIPIRLLGLGLPLTIFFGAVTAAIVFEDVSAWDALLLSAILAPTDAALGQSVVLNKTVPVRIRQALNVESGLNDGICVPVIAFFIALASASVNGFQSPPGQEYWVFFALKSILYGASIGVGAGGLTAIVVRLALRGHWLDHGYKRLVMFAIPLLLFSIAEHIGGSGFIASFTGGIIIGHLTHELDHHDLFDFAEEAVYLLCLITWTIFGIAFVGLAIEHISGRIIVYGFLSLTLIRMLPVAMSLTGMKLHPETTMFLGWFGPRGLASIVFAIMLHGQLQIVHHEHFFYTVTWTIIFSVVAHGVTAAPLAAWFGRRCRCRFGECEEPTVESIEVNDVRPHYVLKKLHQQVQD